MSSTAQLPTMGILEWLLDWNDPTDLDDREEADPYRCLACGTGHERKHVECPECGAQFVVETGNEEQSPDRGRA